MFKSSDECDGRGWSQTYLDFYTTDIYTSFTHVETAEITAIQNRT